MKIINTKFNSLKLLKTNLTLIKEVIKRDI